MVQYSLKKQEQSRPVKIRTEFDFSKFIQSNTAVNKASGNIDSAEYEVR